MRPAIVVVAFNRPSALSRLLGTIGRIKTSFEPHLIISIDDSGHERDAVIEVAQGFEWPWEKTIRLTESRLGLKAHVLACGQLSKEYGSVILLEDDLIVSPAFYDSAVYMLNAYAEEERVAGVSLYSYSFNESADIVWQPCFDEAPVHLMQQVSSWGQAWTNQQWERFENHLTLNEGKELHPQVPENVRQWPDTSWKKHFIDHVVRSKAFVVYPNTSFTSNCGDPGTHFKRSYTKFRTPLALAPIPSELPVFDEIRIRYDAYQELLPEVFKKLNPVLSPYKFQVDLHGIGALRDCDEELVLTRRSCAESLHSWGVDSLPLEMNVLLNISGYGISLAKRADVLDRPEDHVARHKLYDRSPRWVHDALGKPLGERLEFWAKHATPIKPLNNLLTSIIRIIRR